MKYIFFVFFVILSFNARSAPIEIVTGQFTPPMIEGVGYCNDAQCKASVYGPNVYKDLNDTGESFPDTEDFFWSGKDLVERDMVMNFVANVKEKLTGKVTWDSSDLYGTGTLFIFGLFVDLNTNPSGTTYLTVLPNQFQSVYISIKANSLDTYASVTYDFETVPQVPLPASIFLLAPALMGFMRLRRKAKLF